MRALLLSLAALATVSVTLPDTHWHLDWLLLGAQFGLDAVNRPIILASAFAWAVAALAGPSATPAGRLATCGVIAGNAVAVFALDHTTLFAGFACMSLSAYGFFLPLDDTAKRDAARTYLAFAIIAEVMLFTAMLVLIGSSGTVTPTWATVLVIAGFGVKAGLFPIHGTLPLSYRHVDVAAGALLGGAALSVAVLGWLRWLGDVETAAPAVLGESLAWLGAVGYVFAVGLGFTQGQPRAILGYSSVSQVALITIVLGASLASGPLSLAAAEVIAWLALYHAIAKTALFAASSGYPAVRYRQVLWWLAVAAAIASLGGLAMTAGYLAKQTLVARSEEVFGAVATTLVLTGPLSVALLTWFVLTARKSPTTSNDAVNAAALSMAAAGVLALTAWSATAAPSSIATLLYSTLPLAAAVLVVVPFNAWAGRDRAACGDVAALASDNVFHVLTDKCRPALLNANWRQHVVRLLDPKREVQT